MPKRKVISPVRPPDEVDLSAVTDETSQITAATAADPPTGDEVEEVSAMKTVTDWLRTEPAKGGASLKDVEILERKDPKPDEPKYYIVFIYDGKQYTINDKGVTARALRKFASATNNNILLDDGKSMRNSSKEDIEQQCIKKMQRIEAGEDEPKAKKQKTAAKGEKKAASINYYRLGNTLFSELMTEAAAKRAESLTKNDLIVGTGPSKTKDHDFLVACIKHYNSKDENIGKNQFPNKIDLLDANLPSNFVPLTEDDMDAIKTLLGMMVLSSSDLVVVRHTSILIEMALTMALDRSL